MRPIRELIEGELERVEADLAHFRSRAVAVVTTSSGIVTLLTGVYTFAASKAEDDAGLADGAIVLLAFASAFFVVAAIVALMANRGGEIDRPDSTDLRDYIYGDFWDGGTDDEATEERDVCKALIPSLVSIRQLSDRTAKMLNIAIALQIGGVVLVAIGGVVAMASFG